MQFGLLKIEISNYVSINSHNVQHIFRPYI